MSFNNFSDWYKKVLVSWENTIKNMWFTMLEEQDIFIEILKDTKWWLKDLFGIFWINDTLFLEVQSYILPKEKLKIDKWNYIWISKTLKDTILLSFKIASSYSKNKASTEDFLLALIKNNWWLNRFCDYVWINIQDLEKWLIDLNKSWALDWIITQNNQSVILWDWFDKILNTITKNLFSNDNEEETPFDNNKDSKNKKVESKTPTLDFFSKDLTKIAKQWWLDKVIWREDEVKRLLSILNRKTKNNPVLVWEPWVGKTAIVELLASMIIAWNVPFSMRDKKIFALDMNSIVAWTKYRWEFEIRIKQIIDEASVVENEIIIFIDEIHTIIWAWSAEWTLDASNILKPAMWRWKIRVIWATTLNEYSKYIEKDAALERRFQKITVWEPKKEEAIEIINWLKETFEEYHNLNITPEAVKEAVDLSIRYLTDRFLPDKAIDLIDEACSLKSMNYVWDETKIIKIKNEIQKLQNQIDAFVVSQQYEKASKTKEKLLSLEKEISDYKRKFNIPKEKRLQITPKDIKNILSLTTKIPVSDLEKDEIDRLKNLNKILKEKIIWQDEAIESISKSIIRSKTGIWNPNKPIWTFLFLGPTWVWKTQIVKELAKEYFWDEDNLIKIDMSEYSDKTWVSKLIWANAWYIWYEEWWQLTEKVRKKPYSIILFDEIEKRDFDIFNVLLQILDEWNLTDNKWRKVNFKNTIIIMTSNIWQEEFNAEAKKIWFDMDKSDETEEKDYKKISEKIKSTLSDYFPREFINRIDKVVVFSPLTKKTIKKIVNINLEELALRLKNLKNIILNYDKKVINFITKGTYNPEYWAREIKRYIIDNIEDLIASNLLFNKNCDTIQLKIEKNQLIVK